MDWEWLKERVTSVESLLKGLYDPAPDVALGERAVLPFHTPRAISRQLPTDPTGGALTQFPIWRSPALDTKGFATQNGYAQLIVLTDSVPADFNVTFQAVLEGAFNSAWCELDRQTIPYVGPQSYGCPLVASGISMATMVRFGIDAVTTPARSVDFRIDGVLVAGPAI